MRVVWSSWPEYRTEEPPVGSLRVVMDPEQFDGCRVEVLIEPIPETDTELGRLTWLWSSTDKDRSAALLGMATELDEHAKRIEKARQGR